MSFEMSFMYARWAITLFTIVSSFISWMVVLESESVNSWSGDISWIETAGMVWLFKSFSSI